VERFIYYLLSLMLSPYIFTQIKLMGYTLKNNIREDKVKTNGECPIVIRVTINRKSYRHPIGENIDPKNWNKKEDIPRKNCFNRDVIVSKLETEKNKIRDILNQYYFNNNKNYPSVQELKNILNSQKGISGISKSISVYYENFVDEYVKKKNLSHGTKRVYLNTGYRLKEFFSTNKITPTWEVFNDDFYDDFVDFYLDEGRTTEGTIGKYIKNLKTFLKDIYKKYKLVRPEQYETFKVVKDKPDFVVFTKIELLMIKYYIGLIDTKEKDWFDKTEVKLSDRELLILRIMLFLSLTGMSYVDFDKLTYKDLENNEDLENDTTLSFIYIRQKTNIINKVVVTLTEDLVELLIKEFSIYIPQLDLSSKHLHISLRPLEQKVKILWGYIEQLKLNNLKKVNLSGKKYPDMVHYPKIFPKVPNQTFNEEIKLVLNKIGINQNEFRVEKRNRKSNKVEYKKCDIISSGTGRRTFITHSLQDGISMEVLMKSTGHTDIRSLLRYNKVSVEDVNTQFLKKKRRISPTEIWIDRKTKETNKKVKSKK
jgi:integrase